MYTMGHEGNSVDEYNLGTSWDVSSAVYVREYSVIAKETSPHGVFFKPDGSRMYTIGFNGDSVDEYNLGTSWDVSSAVYVREYDVSAKETEPNGLFFKPDGSRMYTIGNNGDSVDEYNLGTSWDVSSAVYVREYSVIAKETNPTGVFFKPDGSRMYTIGHGG